MDQNPSTNHNPACEVHGYTKNVRYFSARLLASLLDSFCRCETDSVNLVPQSYKISWEGFDGLFLL